MLQLTIFLASLKMSIRPTTALLGLFLCILTLPAAFSNDESAVLIPQKEDEGILENAPLETINTNQAQDIGVPADARPPVSSLPGLPPINDHNLVHTHDLGGFPISRPPVSRLPTLEPINDHDLVHTHGFGVFADARPSGISVGLGGLPAPINGVLYDPANGDPSETPKCRSRGGRCNQSAQCCGGFCHFYAHRCVN